MKGGEGIPEYEDRIYRMFDEKAYVTGLSPRVRENPYLGLRSVLYSRSIPACAGEPYCGMLAMQGRRVYTRVCGGTGYLLRR